MSNDNQRSLLSELLFSSDDADSMSSASSFPAMAPQPMGPINRISTSNTPRVQVPRRADTICQLSPNRIIKRRKQNDRNPQPVVATAQRAVPLPENVVLTEAQLQEIERCKETLRAFGFSNPDVAYERMTYYFRHILPRLRMQNAPTGKDDDLPVTDEMLHYHFNKTLKATTTSPNEIELPLEDVQ